MNALPPLNADYGDLVSWISQADLMTDPEALELAKDAFIDTFGCMLAARREEVVGRVFSSLKGTSGGICSVLATRETFSAEAAALVNATAAHALDFDDNFLPAVTHASAVMVPALLALGEEIGVSGLQLLDAYIVGLEVQAWLGRQMIPSHYAAGWHATSTIGAVGATAACIRLLSMTPNVVQNALSLSTSMASGSKIQFGSMAKPLHAGLAARAGISAARLAASGVSGHAEPFSGPWGFKDLHHAVDDGSRLSKLGLSITTDGLAQKKWPCCASAHRTLDAIDHLMNSHDLQAQDITGVETTIPRSNLKNLRFSDPQTVDEARFSMTYPVAVLTVTGGLKLADFQGNALQRKEIRQFMPKVQVIDAGEQSDQGAGIWDYPAVTVIRTTDGTVFEHQVEQPNGTLTHPMSSTEKQQKFLDCAGTFLPREKAGETLGILQQMETHNARSLSRLLRGEGALVS